MSRSRSLSWIPLALALAGAAPASAQSKDPAAGAQGDPAGAPSVQGLYAAAQKLFDKGDYAEALVAFRQAYNGSGSPNARIMIGHCLVGLGKTAEAYEEMAATQREAAKRAETEPKYVPTRDAAAEQVAILEPKIGKIVLEIEDPASVEVIVNSARVSRDKLGVPFAVAPGTVILSATRADGRKVERELTVKAGQVEKVKLTFPAGPEKVPPPDRTTPPPDGTAPPGGEEPSGGGVRIAGFAVAGLGVVGMAVFGITGGMALGRYGQLEDECGGQRCTDPRYAGIVDEGRTLQAVSTAGLVVGAAGLVGGGLMILLGGPKGSPKGAPTGSGRSMIVVSPAGAGARCTLTF